MSFVFSHLWDCKRCLLWVWHKFIQHDCSLCLKCYFLVQPTKIYGMAFFEIQAKTKVVRAQGPERTDTLRCTTDLRYTLKSIVCICRLKASHLICIELRESQFSCILALHLLRKYLVLRRNRICTLIVFYMSTIAYIVCFECWPSWIWNSKHLYLKVQNTRWHQGQYIY